MPMSAANTSSSHRPQSPDPSPRYDHLAALEAESIHIMREVAAEFERPVLLRILLERRIAARHERGEATLLFVDHVAS